MPKGHVLSDTIEFSGERDRRALQAAFLRARHNLSQEEIAKLLGGVSQSHVSRLLNHASDKGWLVTELRFDDRNVSPAMMREIEHLLEPRRLVARFEDIRSKTGQMTPTVRVFDSGSDSPTSGAFGIRIKRFGRSAAGRLEELLRRSSIVGVTWGRTVSSLIDGLEAANRSPRGDAQPTFAPVSAELITLAAPGYSSTLLAGRLGAMFNQQHETLRLSGIPAYIPRRYGAAKTLAIREYLLDAASYRKIFAETDPLVERMDAVITSVGSSARPLGGAMEEVVSAGGITSSELKNLIAGDIGGILIPKPGASQSDVQKVDELNGMWTGITKDHLARIATRSANSGGAGVVVVAIGSERAGIIAQLIHQQMINELIIDWDLANTLEKII